MFYLRSNKNKVIVKHSDGFLIVFNNFNKALEFIAAYTINYNIK